MCCLVLWFIDRFQCCCRNDLNLFRIVGFEVEPHSIALSSMAVVDKNDHTQCALVSGEQPSVIEIKKESK